MRRLLFLLLFSAAGFAATNETSSFFTSSDGVRLHYIEAGSNKARAIVFEPGWTMPAEIFQPQIDALSAKYHVIAIDPRSQGDSDKPVEGNYPGRRAQDMKELVDHLKLDKPVLVGWSMGVVEVLSYIDQFGTANIGGVVMIDEFIKVDPQLAGSFPEFLNSFQVDRRKAAEAFVKSMYQKPQNAAYLKKITDDSLKTPTNTAMALIMGSLARLDWSEMLSQLAGLPVQYHYEKHLQQQADIVRQKLPSAKVVLYADAGHALFVDDAERFNREVEEMMGQAK